jgi:DNA-binding CsgD family transcriptional regulator/PAS domain-containing protein
MGRANFDNVIDAVYNAAADRRTWPDALDRIADHVGGSGAMLVFNDFARNTGTILTARLREDLGHVYVREYCSNPLVRAIAARGSIGKAHLGSRLVRRDALRRTAFHADILEPQRVADQIVLPHAAFSGTGQTGGLGITLTNDQTDRTDDAIDRFNRLAPHLCRALDLSSQLAVSANDEIRLNTLLEMLPIASILVDASGRICGANPQAEAMLSAGDGIRADRGQTLSATLLDDGRKLRTAITRAIEVTSLASDRDFDQALSLQRSSGLPPLLVILTPMPPVALGMWESVDRGARLLVQVLDPVGKLDARMRYLREGYGLTAAEARIAGLVASGITAPKVARMLGLSVSTVRTHIAHCFDKIGVRSQTDLARMIGSLGSLAAASP